MLSPSLSDSLADRLANLTLDLCRIDSVTGDEEAICVDLESRLASIGGLEVTRVGRSLAVRGPWIGRPKIAFVGHTDTVPPHPGDPVPSLLGGQVLGLGSSAMKGGVAVMLALAEDLDLKALDYDLAWVFYDAEEGPFDGSGLGPLLEAVDWLKDVDLAFCLEPSDNVVQVGCVGTLHARVTFHGRSAHSARPWQGDNAVHKAGSLLLDLSRLAPREVDCGGHIFKEVMSITLAEGGRARNVVPESFDLNLNYRFAPNRTLEEACAQVESLVAGRAEVVFVDQSPAGRVVTDNLHFQEFVAQTGVAVTSKQAWTDVARLAQVGVDAVNFGPGNSAQAHQAGETADVGLLAESYQLFRRFLSPER